MEDVGFYKVINAINTEFRNVGFAYVTYGTYTEIDLDKQSLYPYCHIVIPNINEDAILSQLSFDLVVADLVDIQKEYKPTDNEIFDPTNTIDVHQDLMARSQMALKKIDMDYHDIDIVLPFGWVGFKEEFTNLLAGWTITARFQVQNASNWDCE